MNKDSIGLIIFALVALGAVFAFIFVLGGPEMDATGNVAKTQKIGTSHFAERDCFSACTKAVWCNTGTPGYWTGGYDSMRELCECRCQSNTFIYWRSRYSWG